MCNRLHQNRKKFITKIQTHGTDKKKTKKNLSPRSKPTEQTKKKTKKKKLQATTVFTNIKPAIVNHTHSASAD